MTRSTEFTRFFARDSLSVAPGLIGAILGVEGSGGIIVETEAYARDDPASHAFRGRNRLNGSLFGPPGIAYVYRSHGLHWCLNMVCEFGGVLIRALEPTIGLERMRARRHVADVRQLCNGPGKLGEALGIDGSFDGLKLNAPPFKLKLPKEKPAAIVTGPRIGITKAVERPWRFGLSGSAFLSRKFPSDPRHQ